MNIQSNTEFGKLKSIVVGRPDGANWPMEDPGFKTWLTWPGNQGSTFPYTIPEEIIEKVNENIFLLIDRLKVDFNIEVIRPHRKDWKSAIATHDWVCSGMNTLNMRETLITIGNKVIECPHPYRSKHYEAVAYDPIKKYVQENGGVYIVAPKSNLENKTITQKDSKLYTRNNQPLFVGTDILKFGKTLLYFTSARSNMLGAEWLQSVLGDEYKVETTGRFYHYESLCNNIMPLDGNTLLCNADRLSGEAIPKVFKEYKKIWVETLKDKGAYKHPLGSKYVNLQVLNIDERHKMVNNDQPDLCRLLKAHGFEIIESNLLHTQTFAYGYHSLFCDLVRE
tara:strand:- start:267 stop:1277 length:1011 start_codon:yes stop_codon:yes gene_type:complete